MALPAGAALSWRLDLGTDTRGPSTVDFPPMEVGQARRVDFTTPVPPGTTLATAALMWKVHENDADADAKLSKVATIDDPGASGVARGHFDFAAGDVLASFPAALLGEAWGRLTSGEAGPCWRGPIPVVPTRIVAIPGGVASMTVTAS